MKLHVYAHAERSLHVYAHGLILEWKNSRRG